MVKHNCHGNLMHNTCIAIAEFICVERKHTILDGGGFKSKAIYPGEPDVYIEVVYNRTDGKGQRVDGKRRYIIEIEMKPTKDNIEKKLKQFHGDGLHELILIPMNKCKSTEVKSLYDYIGEYIPGCEA